MNPATQIVLGIAVSLSGLISILIRNSLAKLPPIGLERWWLDKEGLDYGTFAKRKILTIGSIFIEFGTILIVVVVDRYLNDSVTTIGTAIVAITVLGVFVTFIVYVFRVNKVI